MSADDITQIVDRLDRIEGKQDDQAKQIGDLRVAIATRDGAATAIARGTERRKMSAREWVLIVSTAVPTLLLCYITWILAHPASQTLAQAVTK